MINKSHYDLLITELLKVNGSVFDYFLKYPYSDIQKKYNELEHEFDSLNVKQKWVIGDDQTRHMECRYVESNEIVSDEVISRINEIQTEMTKSYKNLVQLTDVIKINDIELTLQDIITYFDESSEIFYKYYKLYDNKYIISTDRNNFKVQIKHDDERYEKFMEFINLYQERESTSNPIIALAMTITDDYDLSNIIEQLINENDVINTLVFVRIMTDKNISLSYSKYPLFKELTKQTGPFLRLFRTTLCSKLH